LFSLIKALHIPTNNFALEYRRNKRKSSSWRLNGKRRKKPGPKQSTGTWLSTVHNCLKNLNDNNYCPRLHLSLPDLKRKVKLLMQMLK